MLIAVHVVMALHVALWLIMGTTLSPVEPSESMQTLELGVINAGFIFFILAIVSTLIFGRFFCGWGCHVVALQDLCAWMMNKLGVRPKPFRTRLLVLAPLVLGLYMFVWPSFKRIAVVPVLESAGVALPAWISQPAEFHGFESELIVEDFWATFPPWYVAIPFLGVCGFASVYFLGAKGFCTYGCPYGGIFGVADPISPGRIVVNDSCEGCGHCTAVCTSNVRVHEEVRDFGAVVDPGCMKCLDCVSACPNDALRFAFAKPAVLTKPVDDAARQRRQRIASSPKRFDATMPEELVIAALGVAFFWAFRGMLNLVPMLMAVGMAGVAGFLVWKVWRIIRTPNVRLQSLQLKAKGRIRLAGVVVIGATMATIAAACWSGVIRWDRWRAHLTHESIEVPLAVAMRPEFDPSEELAERISTAIRRFERSDSIGDGGFGWSLRPQDRRELAFLYQLQDRSEDAARQLDLLASEGRPTDELMLQSVRLSRLAGRTDQEILDALDRTLAAHPDLHETRVERSRLALSLGTPIDEVTAEWRSLLAQDPTPGAMLAAAALFVELGQTDQATRYAIDAGSSDAADAAAQIRAARVLAACGDVDSGVEALERVDLDTVRSAELFRSLATAWATLGRRDRAREVLDAGLVSFPDSPSLHESAGLLALVLGDPQGAIQSYRRSIETTTENPFALAGIGEAIVRAGLGSRTREIYELGIETMRRAADSGGEAVLFHDLGQAMLAGGQRAEAVQALERASTLTPENPALQRAAASAKRP